MAIPLRKSEEELEELTTADLAQGKSARAENQNRAENFDAAESEAESEKETAEYNTRPENLGPKPVVSERSSEQRATQAGDSTPLFANNEADDLRGRWKEIQTAFVDEPRKAVEQADSLVASAMKRLAEVFAEERSKLEKQWDQGDNVSTEDLRVALQRYRSFFHRLLSV
jgi:hypothetical protein